MKAISLTQAQSVGQTENLVEPPQHAAGDMQQLCRSIDAQHAKRGKLSDETRQNVQYNTFESTTHIFQNVTCSSDYGQNDSEERLKVIRDFVIASDNIHKLEIDLVHTRALAERLEMQVEYLELISENFSHVSNGITLPNDRALRRADCATGIWSVPTRVIAVWRFLRVRSGRTFCLMASVLLLVGVLIVGFMVRVYSPFRHGSPTGV